MMAAAAGFGELKRWAASAVVVIGLHAGAAAVIARWQDPVFAGVPAAAIVVDLSPIAAAPPELPADIQPGPQQVQSEASPDPPAKLAVEEKVALKPVEEPTLEIPPAPSRDLAPAALPPEPTKSEPPKPLRKPPARETTAPPPMPRTRTAALPVAPVIGVPSPNPALAVSWHSKIIAQIERSKRYPDDAQARREQGIAQLAFTIDRQGRVLASRIMRSSGFASLDQETMATVRRAQPFPPPPPELPGVKFDFTVPMRFNIR